MNNNLVKLEEKEKKYIIRRYNNNFLFKFYLDLYLSDGLIKIKNNQINVQEFHNNYFNKVKKHLSTTNYSFKTANYNYKISCNENGLIINKSDVNNKENVFTSNILFNEIYSEIIQMVNDKTFLTQFENKYLIFVPYLYEALYKKQNNITIDLEGNENEQRAKAIQYIKNIIEEAKTTGSVKTMLNRRRYIPEANASNKIVKALGERLAMNAPIQGSAADIIKIAMINVYKKLEENNLKSKLILQVHDELIVEAVDSEIDIVKKIVKDEMENAVCLDVNLDVDLNIGDSWYDTK